MSADAANLEDDLSLLREPLEQLAERSQRLGEIFEFETKRRTFGLPLKSANQDSSFEEKLTGLQHIVENRIENASAYFRLFLVLIFFIVYTFVLFEQRPITDMFRTETALLARLLNDLPETGMDGYFREGAAAVGYVTEVEELYDWLQNIIVENIFTDPVCGDGICDSPKEYPGFGRFGCEKDCGKYQKTTTLRVDLTTFVGSSPADWDISSIPYSQKFNFQYNIYSHTLQEFMWEKDQDATLNPIVSIDVPDGKLTLHLYQASKLARNAESGAASDLRMNAGDFLVHNDSASPVEYGDSAEVLMFARTVTRGLQDACWETAAKISGAPAGCDKFDWWDSYIRAMGGYGLAGTVSISAGRAGSEVLADIPFCGVLPKGIEGFAVHENKALLLEAQTECKPAPSFAVQKALDPGVIPATISNREGVCVSHKNCSAGLFCARWPHKTGGGRTASRRGGWSDAGAGVCQPCHLCRVDDEDAFNSTGRGYCPRDTCVGSGGMPACLSAARLLENFDCQDKFDFEVWKHQPIGSQVSVKPANATAQKVRYLGAHNRLVGAVVVTQERVMQKDCAASHDKSWSLSGVLGWSRTNPSLSAYTEAGGDQVRCPNENQGDSSPMGSDPVFTEFSSLYDGKLFAADYYDRNERSNASTARVPFLFYPHQYNQITRAPKDDNLVVPSDRNKYKIYFDDRLSQEQAQRMMTALKDGSFFDSSSTQRVSVQLVTYNANIQVFVRFVLNLDWESTGLGSWDFEAQSYSVDLYPTRFASTVRLALEFLLMVFLVLNVVSEIFEIWQEAKVFRLKAYFTDVFNVIDWMSFIFQLVSWSIWLLYVTETQQFKMESTYRVLRDPEAQARFFATSPEEEFKYLSLLRQLEGIGHYVRIYSTTSGMAIVFLIFRLLKSLDFQPRMGLVTRTIAVASTDLIHFMMLFALVFLGYAVVGVLMFGHQFQGMSGFGTAVQTLLMMLLSLDSTKFWTEMDHAAGNGMNFIFQIYIWTYLLLAFFILLNIFLAILIDSYASVKAESESSKGIFEDVYEVLEHFFKKTVLSKQNFMSDQDVMEALLKTRQSFVVQDRTGSVLESQAKEVLGGRTAVLLHGGHELDAEDLVRLVNNALPGCKTEFYDEDDESMYYAQMSRNNAIVDMMSRYGENVTDRMDQQNADVMQLLKIEEMRRQLAIYRSQSSLIAQQKYIMKSVEVIAKSVCPPDLLETLNDVLYAADKIRLNAQDEDVGEIRKLTVEVAQAKNIPKMDLMGKCDSYCVLIINGSGQNNVHSTAVVARNSNPEWNETFTWMISSKQDRVLTITVMDKDNFKNDDLVGCVYVNLQELPLDKEVNQWYPIENPNQQSRLDQCKLRLSLSVRTLAQQAKIAAGRGKSKQNHLLPSRAPSHASGMYTHQEDLRREEREFRSEIKAAAIARADNIAEDHQHLGEYPMDAGWGDEGLACDASAAGTQKGFYPGSSGIGWGLGLPGARPAGNKVAPDPASARGGVVHDSDGITSQTGVGRGRGAVPQKPSEKPPQKTFKRASSSMAAK